jgi:hypothetical protein
MRLSDSDRRSARLGRIPYPAKALQAPVHRSMAFEGDPAPFPRQELSAVSFYSRRRADRARASGTEAIGHTTFRTRSGKGHAVPPSGQTRFEQLNFRRKVVR